MPDKPVISNNTPLVALWVLGRLDLLRDLYGEVLIPQAVHVTGTLGILLLAKEKGLIPALAPLIEELQKAGLHLGTKLVKKVLKLAGE